MNDDPTILPQHSLGLTAHLTTAKEEAWLLGIHRQTLLEKARLGLVPGVRVHRQWWFHHEAVLAALVAVGYPLPRPKRNR